MYQKMDRTNDGLMNAYQWRLDNQPNIVGLSGMVEILERTVRKHPQTTFIACHFANLDYDLARLGELFDRNPNLYADISARYARDRSHTALCIPVLCQAFGSSCLRNRHGIRKTDVSDHISDSGNPGRALLRDRTVRLSLEPERLRLA